MKIEIPLINNGAGYFTPPDTSELGLEICADGLREHFKFDKRRKHCNLVITTGRAPKDSYELHRKGSRCWFYLAVINGEECPQTPWSYELDVILTATFGVSRDTRVNVYLEI